jgi:hypothetical protein
MAELGVVPDGDKEKHKNVIAIKLGEDDFLPIYFEPDRILRDLSIQRGPLKGWIPYYDKKINEEAIPQLLDGYPVTAEFLFQT